MNVALLMPLAEARGGAERLLLELLRHGHDQGVTWTVVFFEAGPLQETVARLGGQTHVVPAGRLREVGRYVKSVWELARLFEQLEVDLVFSWMSKAHLYGGIAAQLAGRPAWWYQHGMPAMAGWMDRLITLVPAAGVLACSHGAAQAQRQLWPRRSAQVVQPCVDLGRFDPAELPSPAEARHRLGLPLHRPLVGLVGRLQRWKGQHVLVEALPMVRKKRSDACLVLVGGAHDLEPDYADFLDRRIDALGMQDHVIRAGFQQDVPLWMQAMDVLVHASDNEPFGMVIIEAMALGKPVVAGANGGPTEIITEGMDGLLAPYGDAGILAGQINRYLGNPQWARRVGEAARRRALDFAPAQYAARFIHLLRRSAGRVST